MPDAFSPTVIRETAPGFATAQVILKPKKARPFYGRHPWVLDSAIARVEGTASDGDVVDLLTDAGKFVARGIFNSRSRIRVRLYTWENAEGLDGSFWKHRLQTAIELRKQLGLGDSDRRRAAGVQRSRRAERPDRRSLRPLAERASHGPGRGEPLG